MKVEDVNRCQIQEWYPRFKLVSIRTFIHELPESFVQYLLDDSGPFLLPVSISNEDAFPNRIHNPEEKEDYQVSEGSGDEAEPLSPPSLPELELKIKESIETLGGAIFPKLNWSAPKDSAWISTSGTLRCTTFSEIALLLRSSDTLIHDLCHAYDSCSDKTMSRPPNFFLALRKWYRSFNLKWNSVVCKEPEACWNFRAGGVGFQSLGCFYIAFAVHLGGIGAETQSCSGRPSLLKQEPKNFRDKVFECADVSPLRAFHLSNGLTQQWLKAFSKHAVTRPQKTQNTCAIFSSAFAASYSNCLHCLDKREGHGIVYSPQL
ncbi:hypothetical protein PVK06_048255 [Gossypium arboreum]|uniref:Cell division cycle protein 123 homolog n=1 Tax=Gossypium arboreum TaxID=29729 RepID=A0ABR0MFZ9_GOSAR|nr:hypothetical protein PVK06_048255 [Gossypium arboreum]